MKILVYLSFAILSVLHLIGCKSSKEVIQFKPYKAKDYMVKEIEVYEVKEWLYSILDSVIVETVEDATWQSLENKTFFFNIELKSSISVDLASSSGDSPEDFVDFVISVVNSPDYFNRALCTNAVFNYKGYNFYQDGGAFLDSFFKKTNKTLSLTCIKPEKFRFDMHAPTLGWVYWINMKDNYALSIFPM